MSRERSEIEYLVNSASSATHGPFATAETAPGRGMFDARFLSACVTAREVPPKMRSGGSILFFSGVLTRRPGMTCGGMGAVKGAAEARTRARTLAVPSN
ncbi:MAG: SDR family oxidoreductase [Pseudomonadota bacterium]